MAMISESKAIFDEWIAAVSRAVDTAAERFVRARQILLREREDGTFVASAAAKGDGVALADISLRLGVGKAQPPLSAAWQAALSGSRVEVELQPAQIMTHQLDFPTRAADFLEGMIRSQIDRVTPWTVNDAVYGWSVPVPAGNDRIEVTLAATSKLKVAPLLRLAEAADAASVAVFAVVPDDARQASRILLLEKPLRSVIGPAVHVPRLLRSGLLAAGVAAAASLLIGAYLGDSLQSELGDVQRQISQRRNALRLEANGTASGLGLLAKRKQTTPSSVIVLEALSHALPDSTYVTELRIEGDKVQVVGMTQDAPSLIRLLEQSPLFTRATFFAPTTRAANEPGERFHIEAHITAYFGSGT
jgi:general secretion pathway protein L